MVRFSLFCCIIVSYSAQTESASLRERSLFFPICTSPLGSCISSRRVFFRNHLIISQHTMAIPSWLGVILVLFATVLFGSMFVTAKKFPSGDGLFFQWIMCVTIGSFGLVVNLVLSSPEFHALAMVGGILWAIGNIFCSPIPQFLIS